MKAVDGWPGALSVVGGPMPVSAMTQPYPVPDPATESLLEKLGRRLRAARVQCSLGQAELAERLGKSQPWVSQVEGGYTGLKVEDLVLFAHECDVKPSKILAAVEACGDGGH